MPAGPGREAVYYTCRACHSLRQFTQQRMARSAWDELLDTMVATNGMEAPEPWARTLILNYLSTHFTVVEHDWQGLPPGEGRAAVFQLCSACHSLAIVKQQGLSRDSWQETLEWIPCLPQTRLTVVTCCYLEINNFKFLDVIFTQKLISLIFSTG